MGFKGELRYLIDLFKRYFKMFVIEARYYWEVTVLNWLLQAVFGIAIWYFFVRMYASSVMEKVALMQLVFGLAFSTIFHDIYQVAFESVKGLYSGYVSALGVKMSLKDLLTLMGRPRYAYIIVIRFLTILYTVVTVLSYIVVGKFVFHISFGLSPLEALKVAGILILGAIANVTLAVLGAISFWTTLDYPGVPTTPVVWLLGELTVLLSGFYYPIMVLPSWLRKIALILPSTHTVLLVKKIIGLEDYVCPYSLLVLLIYVLLLPVAIKVFLIVERYYLRFSGRL